MDKSWLITLIVSGGVSLACALFAKFCPKDKLVGWIKPPCIKFGEIISKFLIIRLGQNGADRVEEGIIVTILTVIGQAPLFIVEGLLEDNQSKKEVKS